MAIGEWALLFGLLVNAAAVVWGMRRIAKNVEVVHHATNSMKDELVKAVGDAALAAGIKQGREERTREN